MVKRRVDLELKPGDAGFPEPVWTEEWAGGGWDYAATNSYDETNAMANFTITVTISCDKELALQTRFIRGPMQGWQDLLTINPI